MAVLGARPVQLPVGEERCTWKQKQQKVRQPRRLREENDFLAVDLIYRPTALDLASSASPINAA